MKRIQLLLSCALIIGSAQLIAMKRDQSHITPEPEIGLINNLAPEIITKVAALCEPQARARLSVTNTYFNLWASEKKNNAMNQEENFTFYPQDRLFYLFDGCMNNIENLVRNTLRNFNPTNASEHFWLEHTRNYCREKGMKAATIAHIERALGKKDA